jgi:phosphoadenosine phosphosulfate reductase
VLILSKRLTKRDLETWRLAEDRDRVHCQRAAFKRRVKQARDALVAFTASAARAYIGVNWGKDSVVVAHLAVWLKREKRRTLPLVWLRSEPGYNPDCLAVRDEFRRMFPEMPYDEIATPRRKDADGWHSTGTMEAGFEEATRRYGLRHVSGVRSEEGTARALRMYRWGESTEHTCAPIGWWTSKDVFAYLYVNGLPVHPAYAMTQGGLWERDRLRVASIDETQGRGRGRAEWEAHYYPDVVAQLR